MAIVARTQMDPWHASRRRVHATKARSDERSADAYMHSPRQLCRRLDDHRKFIGRREHLRDTVLSPRSLTCYGTGDSQGTQDFRPKLDPKPSLIQQCQLIQLFAATDHPLPGNLQLSTGTLDKTNRTLGKRAALT